MQRANTTMLPKMPTKREALKAWMQMLNLHPHRMCGWECEFHSFVLSVSAAL
jgi:hypothetical protein